MENFNKNQKGQGLLEAIVATTVIATGLVGVINLAIMNQTGSSEGGERLEAANLAREAVEVARNKRDGNWLAGVAWDTGLEGSGNDYTAALMFDESANGWTLDFTADTLAHNDARVWRQAGAYFQSDVTTPPGATLTVYRRLLTLDEICQDKTIAASGSFCNPKIGVRASVEVQWVSRGTTSSLVVEERLFNWR